MLTIRLRKIGKKHEPAFRVILSPKGTPPRGGRFLEILGNYNPKLKTLVLNKERILYWLSQGAQPSITVYNLLVKQGIVRGPKRKIKMSKPLKSESEPLKLEGKPSEKIEIENQETIDKSEELSKMGNNDSGA